MAGEAEGGSGFAIHPMDQFVVQKLFCTDDHATPLNECTTNIQWYDIEPGTYPAHYLVEPAGIRFVRKNGIRFRKNSVEDQDAEFGIPTRTHNLKSQF